MANDKKTYRIRTEIGSNAPNVVNVKLDQSFEFLNILSLKIGQKNLYKIPSAPYGVVVGRVLANRAYGVENAKVSVFIPKEDLSFDVKENVLYAYSTVDSVNHEGVRYNLLPSYVDEVCHQNIGTMFEKEYVLDNNDVINVFDRYYTYTTRTNASGDYCIYGVPVGQYTLHVDVDLSDVGKLSVRPHDMIGQGYDTNMFENPNKFKDDKNLNILPQVKSQDTPIYIHPFWGDTTEDYTNATITRADIEIDYKFEPTAVFMGSIVTDKGSNSISHKCVADKGAGKMSDLSTGEGIIEMIRKTFDGKVEQFSVKGNRVIDGNGVWCYQIPMNLDYVGMDEFGNLVPTDDPNKGLPTRARVRFRVSMDEDPMDDSARKRARFLIPNNPRLTSDYPEFSNSHEADYEFGTFTKEENYRDLFWNNVYTVKSYIPRLQRSGIPNIRKHTGIKMVNHPGDNNPMPYNNLTIRMGFMYRFLCSIMTVVTYLVYALNTMLASVGIMFMNIALFLAAFGRKVNSNEEEDRKPITRAAGKLAATGVKIIIEINAEICESGSTLGKYYILGKETTIKKWFNKVKELCELPGENYDKIRTSGQFTLEDEENTNPCEYIKDVEEQYITNGSLTIEPDEFMNCVQNALAQDNEVTSFNFYNDWVNGVLYAPLWYRKIRPKKRIRGTTWETKGLDVWCNGESAKATGSRRVKGVKLCQTCAQQRKLTSDGKQINPIERVDYERVGKKWNIKVGNGNKEEKSCYGFKCHRRTYSLIKIDDGLIMRRETKYGEYVYYYKSVEYDENSVYNILNPSEKGEVKLLFATDLVLLGSLNNCDINGIPQFFKHLGETTYQMPPDLVSLSWDITENEEKGEDTDYDEDIVGDATVEYSGADYGEVGKGQWYYDEASGQDVQLSDNVESVKGNKFDNGGLFYNLTCLGNFVKPKGCVNMSRLCEFGVSLDQSMELLDTSGTLRNIPPDGFVSYDEIYNMDARAMFATLNGNRLREKTNLKTGYPVYDFNYTYPENFDGTLKTLMSDIPSVVSYSGNKNLEMNSESYVRFRYGYDKNMFRIGFYNTGKYMPNIADAGPGYTNKNERRFPRYENSFYFYFGLKSGSTAINRFREQFYSECENDGPSETAININYRANEWCNDIIPSTRDAYISFDLTNVELPCSITLDELNEGDAFDVTYKDINSYKLYIGGPVDELDGVGYDRLYVDEDNRQVEYSEDCITPTVKNGRYAVTITDLSGEQYRQILDIVSPKLKYDSEVINFTLTNEELSYRFQDDEEHSRYYYIASDGTRSEGNTLRRDIGGYIHISNMMNNGGFLGDNFIIRITPSEHISGYTGSEYRRIDGQVSCDGVWPFYPQANSWLISGYTFGLPKANMYYTVTVTQYCPMTGEESGNSVSERIYVGEPGPFKMYVNGVDSDLLKKFDTGYLKGDNGVINRPYDTYNEYVGIDKDKVVGWLDMGKVGVSNTLEYVEEGHPKSYQYIESSLNALRPHNSDVYSYTEDYYFNESDVDFGLEVFDEVPETNQGKYIKVKATDNTEDETAYVWQWYQGSYQMKYVNGHNVESITLQEYFETNDVEAQNNVIEALNNVIQRRLDLVNSMVDAFCMYTYDDKIITVTSQTNSLPVKTLVYYMPGSSSNGVLNVTSGYLQVDTGSFQNSTAGYIMLDKNKEENTIVSFGSPTITHAANQPIPIFTKIKMKGGLVERYKLPPYCAIKNSINETIPSEVGTIPFGNQTIAGAMSSIPNGMDSMFGFHIIDKRPFTKLNVWIPVKNYPIYWPDVNTYFPTSVQGFERGGYFSMNGCASGFLYNGFSKSKNRVAEFEVQDLGVRVNFYTITTKNSGGDVVPDEFAVPTKRLMYIEPFDNEHIYTYNDFMKNDNPKEGFDSDSIDTGSVNTDYRYVSFGADTEYLVVDDGKTIYEDNLHSQAVFGIPEDTFVYPGAKIKPSFQGIEGVVNYTVVSGVNPLFQKVYDNSPDIINENQLNVSMVYNYQLNAFNETIPGNSKKVFFIGWTTDGKYRAISPTYEVSNIKAEVYDSGPDIRVDIVYKENEEWRDHYLRYYPHQVVLDYWVGGVKSRAYSSIENGKYETLYQNTSGERRETLYIEGVSLSSVDYDDSSGEREYAIAVYVKDVTGIIRDTTYNYTYND